MAEKKNNTFDGIMADMKKGVFAPVYILMGEEPYYIDAIANYILEHALQPEERDFNQTVLYGIDVDNAEGAARLVNMAKDYPMMAERRVVMVKEAQNMRSFDALEKYFERIMPSTILVLCYKGKIDRRKKFVNQAAKIGVLFESTRKNDRELVSFINQYIKEKGATADNKAVQMIKDHVGADLPRIVSEIDKLLVALNDGDRRITPELVEDRVGVSKDFNVFELRNALVHKDVFKANQIVKYFNNNPKAGSLYSILPNLFSFFQNLMIAYYAPDKRNEKAVANFLGLNSEWGARDYVTAMRNYSGTKTLQIISKMREIDAKSKGLDNPNTGADELFKELVYFILH
ncbi:MAG: DNA polymerase III subunit delta [Prevotella sp.]|nr:DNA polymerase III subunit delta [Prevotella sp.]